MKKLLALTLAIVLSLTLAACGGNSGNGGNNTPSASPANSPSANPANSPDNGGSNGEQSWPTSNTYNVPEWEDITKYYGGGGSLDDHIGGEYMMNVVAPEESLNQYLDKLRGDGYEVSDFVSPQFGREITAKLGPVSITITPKTMSEGNGYQVDIFIRETGSWPSPDEYPVILSKPAGYEVFGVDIWPEELNGYTYYFFEFTCADMGESAAEAYISDNYELAFEWDGGNWYCMVDEENTYPDGSDMVFRFIIYPEELE